MEHGNLEGREIHFIGIGGKGMSALAQICLEIGCRVSGSDLKPSSLTRRLEEMGASVRIGHDPSHVERADTIVYSTDIPDDNVELERARAMNLDVLHRSELLAGILNEQCGIAVTGTHGKTTTTGMVSMVLLHGGLDPTVLVGEETPGLGGNARVGGGEYIVAEADESDRSFLRYHPRIAVVTNIEADHLEYYDGRLEKLVAGYGEFLAGVDRDGLAVLCLDDPRLRKMVNTCPVEVMSYGTRGLARVQAREIRLGEQNSRYSLWIDGKPMERIVLQDPGLHNIKNSLAACSVGLHLGVDLDIIRNALYTFHGARRRFEVLLETDELVIVDDYAHHPTEIRATLVAARQGRGERRITAVFQPQRYTRTSFLMDAFTRSFSEADRVIIADIYSPEAEEPIPGVTSEVLARHIAEREEIPVHYLGTLDEVYEFLREDTDPGDLVLTMGAGDVWRVAHRLAEEYTTQERGAR